MNISNLKEIVVEHKKALVRFDGLIDREVLQARDRLIASKEVIVITGVRRSGKSSLMKLIARDLLSSGVSDSNLLYINFDDDRLISFSIEDFEDLLSAYLELCNPDGKKYFFLDEIQNVPLWEKWVNRLYELEDVKIFVTGSNSSMLSSEYSTLLTGRNSQIINYPFSFSEHLAIANVKFADNDLFDKNNTISIKRELGNYYDLGGFPEVVKNKDLYLLEQYFKDIIYRDIIVKNGIKQSVEVREMAIILASESSSLQTYNRLKNLLGVKSQVSIKNYMSNFADSYLFFPLSLFSYSVKQQIYNPKKIYCVDTGLARAVSFASSENEGRRYENIVFLELLRRNEEIYYWKSASDKEVDFIIKKGTAPMSAIQVAIDIGNVETKNREFEALVCAYNELGIRDLKVLTKDEEYRAVYKEVKIEVIPIWKYLILNK